MNVTPGPWEVDGIGKVNVAQVGRGLHWITADGTPSMDRMEADATLIAAAPDLLASLREFVGLYDASTRHVCGRSMLERLARADAALAKAEGRIEMTTPTSTRVFETVVINGRRVPCGCTTRPCSVVDVFEGGQLTVSSTDDFRVLQEYPEGAWVEAICYDGEGEICYRFAPGMPSVRFL